MENNTERLTMTVKEVCAVMGVSRPIVDRFIHRKENPIPCIKTGRNIIIPREPFCQWLIDEAARQSGGKR